MAAHPGKIWEALIRRASCQANQESEMPIFITQGRYTQSALTGMIASSGVNSADMKDAFEKAKLLAPKVGGVVLPRT
jgi:hypothetical protein